MAFIAAAEETNDNWLKRVKSGDWAKGAKVTGAPSTLSGGVGVVSQQGSPTAVVEVARLEQVGECRGGGRKDPRQIPDLSALVRSCRHQEDAKHRGCRSANRRSWW